MRKFFIGIVAVAALGVSACAGTDDGQTRPSVQGSVPSQGAPQVAPRAVANTHAGWYRDGMFQPCGSAAMLKPSRADELDSQIRAAGMQLSDPVYVKLEGAITAGTLNVARVAQVGSPTPVRDCAMTGTSIQGG